MTEAAGAAADGLLIHPFSTERYLREVTVPAVERGRAGAPNPAKDFDLVSAAFVVSGDTEEEMAASAVKVRNQIAFYGSTPSYQPVFELHGWSELGTELNRLSRTSADDRWQQMGRLIPDDVLAEFAVVGEPDSVGPRLIERFANVITRYEVNHVGIPDPEMARRVARSVQRASSPV